MEDIKFNEVRRVVLIAELKALLRIMARSSTTDTSTVEMFATLDLQDMTFDQLRLLRDEVERVVRAIGGNRQG